MALTIYLFKAAQGLQIDPVLSNVCPTILSQSSLRIDADSVILQISFFNSQIWTLPNESICSFLQRVDVIVVQFKF